MITVKELKDLEVGDKLLVDSLFPYLAPTDEVSLEVVDIHTNGIGERVVQFAASFLGVPLGGVGAIQEADKIKWKFQ
jgi:hypothetical protein